ncbi:hypothetical protein BDZ89DRAFT_1079163, partial [Hymenopellis radicata]
MSSTETKEAPIDKEPVLTQEEEKKEESAVPTAKPTEEPVKEPVPDDLEGTQDRPTEKILMVCSRLPLPVNFPEDVSTPYNWWQWRAWQTKAKI